MVETRRLGLTPVYAFFFLAISAPTVWFFFLAISGIFNKSVYAKKRHIMPNNASILSQAIRSTPILYPSSAESLAIAALQHTDRVVRKGQQLVDRKYNSRDWQDSLSKQPRTAKAQRMLKDLSGEDPVITDTLDKLLFETKLAESLEKSLDRVVWQNVAYKAVDTFNKHAEELCKEGESPVLRQLAEYMNLVRGEYPGGIPNHPGPLASMLVGGIAGAGLGYGLGALGETMLPNTWERGALRRTGLLAGGALGVTPGLLWGAVNKMDNRNFNDNTLFQQKIAPTPKPKSDVLSRFKVLDSIPQEISDNIKASWAKTAELYPGSGVVGPSIDLNKFLHTVWDDPRVAGPLSPSQQAAATGLVVGAANLPGKTNTGYVTPMDVARMSAGMGSGYLSGMLVGKALGVMTGMPNSTQDMLKSTGMYAGLLQNLIPIAFGTR